MKEKTVCLNHSLCTWTYFYMVHECPGKELSGQTQNLFEINTPLNMSENAYVPRNIFFWFDQLYQMKDKTSFYVPFFSCIIRSSQLNYKGSVYKSVWVSEQHSRFTIQKVKQLHSIPSLKGNILIHSFLFLLPVSCGSAFWYAVQTCISHPLSLSS